MAKRKSPPTPLSPTPERVAAAIRSGDFLTALEFSRQLLALAFTSQNVSLRKQAIAAAAAHYAETSKFAEFNLVMADAASLDADNAEWTVERATLLARGGMTSDAIKLIGSHPEPAVRLRVLGFAADRAVRRQSKEYLPDDLHAGFDAILAAFKHHEMGDEAVAREVMEPIGLRSPFLEWKVLLRGLLAFAAGDDTRALENIHRLDPQRLPHRLAAPIRAAIDSQFKEAQPPAAASALLAQYQKMSANPIVEAFRSVARHLGRDKPLAPAFKTLEGIISHLKQTTPDLVTRLANCVYHAILRQGHPDDLARYRRLFGQPVHDPDFWSLQARISEEIGNRVQAHSHWQKYERWLASNPPGWPVPLLARARAEVWACLGDNALQHSCERTPEDEDAFGFFNLTRPQRKKKPLDPPADFCFRRAVELAPDCADAVRLLFESLIDAKRPVEAESAVRSFLAIRPDNLSALESLANLLQTQGRAAEMAETWLRALALNPLDKPTRFRTATAILSCARRKLIGGDVAGASAGLAPHRALLDEQTHAALAALEAVIAMKLGRPEDAERAQARALAFPGARVGAAYRMMVDSQLAKLKPADKKVTEKLFAEEYTKPPTPLEANQLIAAYDAYHIDNITYRGQKTHQKKVLDLSGKCLAADGPEIDFERLADLLMMREEYKHAKKLLDGCRTRFPKNPLFWLLSAEVGLMQSSRIYAVDKQLAQAKYLAERSNEPRHRALLERIAQIRKRFDMPTFFDTIFDRFED